MSTQAKPEYPLVAMAPRPNFPRRGGSEASLQASSDGGSSHSPGSSGSLSPSAEPRFFRPWLSDGGCYRQTPNIDCGGYRQTLPKMGPLFPSLRQGSRNPDAVPVEVTALLQQQSLLETLATRLGKDGRSHRCLFCAKVYSRKYGLKIHLRTHTSYKPLKCRICERAFSDPSNLNKHTRMHKEAHDRRAAAAAFIQPLFLPLL